MRDQKDRVIRKLKHFTPNDVLISSHAKIRMIQRQITVSEVIDNIINPRRLEYALTEDNLKYDCYFNYSRTQCQRYILNISNTIEVLTVIKINRRWQRVVEKKLRGKNEI